MTAAVVPLPLSLTHHDLALSDAPAAEARKRRREILASQRGAGIIAPDPVSSVVEVCAKKRKISGTGIPNTDPVPTTSSTSVVSTTTTTTKTGKKPQMKYDPDVPMTKEEAAAWRREQRRKRNRESAAASRQRQRDRIAELEVEVSEWKSKFEAVMNKIRMLEEAQSSDGQMSSSSIIPEATSPHVEISSPLSPPTAPTSDIISPLPSPVPAPSSPTDIVSPLSSPVQAPACVSPTVEPVISLVDAAKVTMDDVNQVSEEEGDDVEPTKMISRPAVKISGHVQLPILPEDSLLCPDPCASSEIKLEPIDSSYFPCPADKLKDNSSLLIEDENETEFGEFLLDAVDWL